MKKMGDKIQKEIEILLEKKPLALAIWSILVVAAICMIIGAFVIIPNLTGSKEYFNVTKTGPLGDTFNGMLGPFIAFLVAILTFLAFYIQFKANEIQNNYNKRLQFENKFNELIHLHRENINELRYIKDYKGKMETSESRKVFRVIFKEYMDCFHEIKRFAKIYPEYEILYPKYKVKLEKIKRSNKCRASVEELAIIDMAFCFVYFGLSKESDTVVLSLFHNRYNQEFGNRLRKFLQLKPKGEEVESFKAWDDFKKKNINEVKKIFEEIYNRNFDNSGNILSVEAVKLVSNYSLDKYYGGHQHRLGHYFRHLFHSFKFLSSQIQLTDTERYFYGKTLRAQLSTYEQFLLFVNSLSSVGMKWEYTADVEDLTETENKNLQDIKFITRYNLIKNLPGHHYFDFTYSEFYPNVNFEYRDDISYQ